jgi:prevent-host-death family protein
VIEKTITVTEAARHFADVVERTHRRRESTLVLKKGKPVARIVPVPARAKTGRELGRLWAALPHLSVEAAGLLEVDLAAARRHLPPLRSQWE